MIDVAVHAAGPREVRAAQALAAEPTVGRVALLGAQPPGGWGIVRTDTLVGWDVLVGAGVDTVARAEEAGIAAVIADEPATPTPVPVVAGASPAGLARCLAVRLTGRAAAPLMVVAGGSAEARAGRRWVRFPAPVGRVRPAPADAQGISVAEAPAPWGGVLVANGGTQLVVVDDARFLEAACLAAGVTLIEGLGPGTTPVWARAGRFLRSVYRFGLVAAESVNPPPEGALPR